MSKIKIYHGSNVAVPNPKILINGYYKDLLGTLTFEGSVTL